MPGSDRHSLAAQDRGSHRGLPGEVQLGRALKLRTTIRPTPAPGGSGSRSETRRRCSTARIAIESFCALAGRDSGRARGYREYSGDYGEAFTFWNATSGSRHSASQKDVAESLAVDYREAAAPPERERWNTWRIM